MSQPDLTKNSKTNASVRNTVNIETYFSQLDVNDQRDQILIPPERTGIGTYRTGIGTTHDPSIYDVDNNNNTNNNIHGNNNTKNNTNNNDTLPNANTHENTNTMYNTNNNDNPLNPNYHLPLNPLVEPISTNIYNDNLPNAIYHLPPDLMVEPITISDTTTQLNTSAPTDDEFISTTSPDKQLKLRLNKADLLRLSPEAKHALFENPAQFLLSTHHPLLIIHKRMQRTGLLPHETFHLDTSANGFCYIIMLLQLLSPPLSI